MADQHFSTNKLSEDTKPETPRLLIEGVATIGTTSFSAVTGGYSGSVSVNITNINDIGNTNKVFTDPASYKIEVFHYFPSTSEFSVFRPLPYDKFSNFSTGQVDRWAYFEVINQHVLVGDIYLSTLTIYYFADTNTGVENDDAGDAQHFIYKIWSVPFKYDI